MVGIGDIVGGIHLYLGLFAVLGLMVIQNSAESVDASLTRCRLKKTKIIYIPLRFSVIDVRYNGM